MNVDSALIEDIGPDGHGEGWAPAVPMIPYGIGWHIQRHRLRILLAVVDLRRMLDWWRWLQGEGHGYRRKG